MWRGCSNCLRRPVRTDPEPQPEEQGSKAPTEDEWTLMLMGVVFEGIKHKIDAGIPLTESQQEIYDRYS